ncbi:MAG: carbamate kinase [Acidimicrobiia bacterium]|nr:carbamate kinase [Acidimicrobiia bacterium]
MTAWRGTGTRPVVVAFGGNALLPDPDDPGAATERARGFAEAVLLLVPDHAGLVLVHGNGPQVGAILLRVEATRDRQPPEPLDVLVAETQGSIGYLLERSLRNALAEARREVEVATVMTEVVVDRTDPAMVEPTKPIGPFYPPAEGRRLAEEQGWDVVEVPDRGVRRVVPSPRPVEVVEIHTIADAARHGHLVIAGGGGGVPVWRDTAGALHGVEGVVDKDRTAALLATELRAGAFVVLTGVAHVSTGFGTAEERPLHELTVERARGLLADGEFPEGTMGPKIEAAVDYVTTMRRPALITNVEALPAALAGTDGTWITR